ncbi:MAG: prolipoprotein diacylglyceryl transferase [Magnetococcales bacterium]|nr:prolipoprotein diacylglyceryl transferase [Magnetococcales bacterium]
MMVYPEIDPVLFAIGPLTVRWYGFMYTLAFLTGWPLLQIRARRIMPELSSELIGDIAVWTLLGLVLGGRFGYIVFYQPAYYLDNPLAVLKIWQGGMSFHGGLIGGLVACVLFSRRWNIGCLALADLVFPVVPVGLFLGRIGNFINGELWGRVTDSSWGMVFPGAGPLPRHPSQLYEAFLEGIVLFSVLWWLGSKPRKPGFMLGAFLIGYAACRFSVEFFREPDAHLGLLAMSWSMGQWLSLPMVVGGAWLLWRKPKP